LISQVFQARIFISALLIALPILSPLALFAQSPIRTTFEADEVGKFPSGWTSKSVSKAAGIAPLLIAKIFSEYDYSLLDTEIKWVMPVTGETIVHYMNGIAMAIIEGSL